MADKLSVKDKMLAAKQYIDAKDYGRARAVLKTVNHPTAREWEKKLDGMGKPAKVKRGGRYTLRRMVLVLMAVAVTVFIGLMLLVWQQDQAFYKRQLPEARSILSVFCTFSTTLADHRCEQWINEVFEEDIKRSIDVVTCSNIYNPISEPENFARCLARNEIYLP